MVPPLLFFSLFDCLIVLISLCIVQGRFFPSFFLSLIFFIVLVSLCIDPGATNRPQDIDEAARRRLVKRLYIPLPDAPARLAILRNLLYDTVWE